MQHLEEAHVSTIHGFCADLLRERPVEAGVDPLFRVLTEGQAERLFDEAFAGWFQARLEDPPEGVRRSLRRFGRAARPGEVDEDGPVERLRRAGFGLTEWRDFRSEWTREPFDRPSAIARLIDLVHALADVSAAPSYSGDNLFLDTEPVRRLSRDLRAQGGADDLDGMEARLIDLRRNRDFTRARKGTGPGYRKGVTRAQVLDARGELMAALEEFRTKADADLAAVLHRELLACVDAYEALKTREGALDFLDLLLRARNLVRDDAQVRRHFQQRFKRIFVDEFQDTDPLAGGAPAAARVGTSLTRRAGNTSLPSPASSSSWAIRSSPFTVFAARTSAPTSGSATSSWRAARSRSSCTRASAACRTFSAS